MRSHRGARDRGSRGNERSYRITSAFCSARKARSVSNPIAGAHRPAPTCRSCRLVRSACAGDSSVDAAARCPRPCVVEEVFPNLAAAPGFGEPISVVAGPPAWRPRRCGTTSRRSRKLCGRTGTAAADGDHDRRAIDDRRTMKRASSRPSTTTGCYGSANARPCVYRVLAVVAMPGALRPDARTELLSDVREIPLLRSRGSRYRLE
jgi:hypothetical protein